MIIVQSLSAGFKVGGRDFLRTWNFSTWTLGWCVRIITNALVWIYLGHLIGSEHKTLFLLVGNAMLAGPFSITWTIPAATWDRSEGAYALLLASPANLWAVLVGRTSVWFINGIVTTWVSLFALGALFDHFPPLPNLPILAFAVIITCASVYAVALVFGVIANRLPRLRVIFSNLLQVGLMTFCGVNVPIHFWPPLIANAVQFFPLTNGLDAVRIIYANGESAAIVSALIKESSVTGAWLLLSYILYALLNRHSRNHDDIDII